MRLLRYDAGEGPRLGALRDDGVVRLDAAGFPTMLSIIGAGEAALDRINDLMAHTSAEFALKDIRLLAPIERPSKFLGIGMNYGAHAAEAKSLGIDTPQHQLWFNKQTTCLSGPFDTIEPGVTKKLDYEAELAVVIGMAAKSVSTAEAENHVFGYCIANDVSARDWQFHSQTFTMGKSFDTHGPIGPWIVTRDEIPDPHALDIRCLVNGFVRQDSNTRHLIHNIWAQISYLSTAFTLEPGDILATGTPEGVGIAMDPPCFLQPGDVVRCEIDGIGFIENEVAGR